MIRTTGFFGYFRLLSVGSAGALILATGLSCSDGSTAPSSLAGDLGAMPSVVFHHSLAEKSAAADAAAAISASSQSLEPSSVQALSGSRISSVTATPMYSVFPVAFAPLNVPLTKIAPADDKVGGVSMGFLFPFYGNNFNIAFISSNGFVGFRNTIGDGYKGGSIPNPNDAPYNNLVALAWTDLDPMASGASYSYASIGTAPNRKFVVQWTNVPEYDLAADPLRQKTPGSPVGHLTGQLVLSENGDITMYTSSLDISSSFHPVTQGIENIDGSEAAFLPGRVNAHYATPLVNDGVRFSFSHANQPPVVVAPADMNVNADHGLCSALVTVSTPSVKDDAAGWSIVGVRSDAPAKLNAPYPVVVSPAAATSILWTATDAGGLTATASQAINVKDAEAPTINSPAAISVNVDRGKQTAKVDLQAPAASDNCSVTVSGSRSDNQLIDAPFGVGTTTVKWVAIDPSGNSASVSQTVTVSGNQAPTISVIDIAVPTDSSYCSAKLDPQPVVSDDDPDGLKIVGVRSDAPAAEGVYPKGLTTIKWTVTDAGGLSDTATQKILVSDKEKPSIHAPPNASAGDAGNSTSGSVSVGKPDAGDNCKIVDVDGKRSDGADLSDPYPIGTTTITWSAVDPSLNWNSAKQSVTVLDVSAPVFGDLPSLVVNATMPSGAVVHYSASAIDNVGVASLVCSPVSGSVFAIGPHHVDCSAKDAAGNEAVARFDVTVLGAQSQIEQLMAKVRAMNLSSGVANPLLSQLETALRSPGSNDPHVACVKMGDFISLVQSVRGNSVSQEQAGSLINDAQQIRAVLGC